MKSCSSATCRILPEDSIIIQREMSRLVVTITHGREIIYSSPLSAHRLNELALSETQSPLPPARLSARAGACQLDCLMAGRGW
jgi:hypothetical protein